MPIRMGSRTYKSFSSAAKAVARRKGWSYKRAAAYVASVERRQGMDPRTGRRIRKRSKSRRR